MQFTTWQGKHFVRSNDGNVPGEQRTHDFFANGKPLGSVSTAFVKRNFKKLNLGTYIIIVINLYELNVNIKLLGNLLLNGTNMIMVN